MDDLCFREDKNPLICLSEIVWTSNSSLDLFVYVINKTASQKCCASSAREFYLCLNFLEQTFCCILHGPGGESIIDVVPRGMELELQLRRGVWQAAHARNNPHVQYTGVY